MDSKWHSFVGELLGTFLLVFFGCSAVASAVLFEAQSGLLQVAILWGIGVSLAIYATRHLSCAHLNPAVSLAMVLAGRMMLRKLPIYLLAQFLGAFLASAFLYFILGGVIAEFEAAHQIVRGSMGSLQTAMIFGDYFPHPILAKKISLSFGQAFLCESTGTFLLVLMIFVLTEGCNVGRPPSDIAPVLIGFTVTAIIGILAPLTQAGLNPARDFGPRLFSYLAGWGSVAIPGPGKGCFVVYIIGPFVGSIFSAWFFRKILLPLMESKSTARDDRCCR
jgi:glycerol uptake facilitator protein